MLSADAAERTHPGSSEHPPLVHPLPCTAHDTPTLRLGLQQDTRFGCVFVYNEIQRRDPPYFLELDSSQIQQVDAYLAQAPSKPDGEPVYREYFTGSARPSEQPPG